MIILHRILFFSILLIIGTVLGQNDNVQKVIYKVHCDFQPTAMDKQKEVYNLLRQTANYVNFLEYELIFDSTKSHFSLYEEFVFASDNDLYFKLAKKLGGDAGYYIDLDNKENLISKEFLDELYLIHNNNSRHTWDITEETRMINNIECIRAELVIVPNGTIENTKRKIIAWFAPSIKAPFGPKGYGGLPGLILELQENKLSYYILSLDDLDYGYIFSKPNEGIEINKEEYDTMVRSKMTEFGFLKD